ncbi:MAG: SDR family NAD(P)-dependent oxidoreductase [Acidobacteria bacterium]|nr:SDR family NAD(P)-dependent oxidoreductase [Acidobacteriota bacterium]
MQLQDKVAIVTGSSRGIGRQIAIDLAALGARVVVAARTVEPRPHVFGTIGETVAAIEAAGGTAIAVATDVRVEADLRHLVATTVDTFGRLDILVNNAADLRRNDPIDKHSYEVWRKKFDTNVHGPFLLMSQAVPHMRAQGGGVIVNVTSRSGDLEPVSRLGELGLVEEAGISYGVTKAALNRLTNIAAAELLGDNIAVVAVEPGFTRTEGVAQLAAQGQLDDSAAHPMSVPARLVIDIITAADPLSYTGQIARV